MGPLKLKIRLTIGTLFVVFCLTGRVVTHNEDDLDDQETVRH